MLERVRVVLIGLVALACQRGPAAGSPAGPQVDTPAATSGPTQPDPAQPADATPPDPGPPITLTAVPQFEIGPASRWRFDPDGRYVAWDNDGRCGLWRHETGAFVGYFDRQPDDPCERWPEGRSSFIETSAEAPAGAAMVGATAKVQQTTLVVIAADGSKLLDVQCSKCRRYRALAWSPDGTQIAAARSDPWGIDLWSIAEQKLVDQIDVDVRGKETDIGVLWGREGMFAFVSHAYDPNEGREVHGMEDYTHVHGPALSSVRIPLPRHPDATSVAPGVAREIRSVSTSLANIVIDPQLGAAWVRLRSEDPREFGHSYWERVELGGASKLGGLPLGPDSVGDTINGYYVHARWVERPYEILEAGGSFSHARGSETLITYEALGLGMSGDAWVRRTSLWSRPSAEGMALRDVKLDGVGVDWAELRARACPAGNDYGVDEGCEAIGLSHRCELVDFTPDGERLLAWCPPKVALLERDGTTVLELAARPPAELRWRWVDGDTLALLGDDRKLRLISVSRGREIESIDDVRQIYPLVAGAEFDLFAYRTGRGFVLRSVDGKRRYERSTSVFAAAIDPTGERVALTDLKQIEIVEIATGTSSARWRASKIRKLAYRQDGAVLFGTTVRERGPTRAWDPQTGAEQNDAMPSTRFARLLADDPSWRWAWDGLTLCRSLDGRSLSFDFQGAMLDNGLYEGEVPRALGGVVLRRGDSIDDFEVYDAVDLVPLLRREGLVDAFLAGERMPEVIVGELDLARAVAARDEPPPIPDPVE